MPIPPFDQLQDFVDKLKRFEPLKESDPKAYRDLYIELTIVMHGHLQSLEKQRKKAIK